MRGILRGLLAGFHLIIGFMLVIQNIEITPNFLKIIGYVFCLHALLITIKK